MHATDCVGGIHVCAIYHSYMCHSLCVSHSSACHTLRGSLSYACHVFKSFICGPRIHSCVGHSFNVHNIHMWATYPTCMSIHMGATHSTYIHGWPTFICPWVAHIQWVAQIYMWAMHSTCMGIQVIYMGATHWTHMRVGRTNAHGTYMKESWHGTRMNELRTPYELVECIRMSHIWMSHEPVCHTW